jgi:hypothetical protein
MNEWITDRLPTAEDALEDTVLVWNGSEAILWTYDGVEKGQPWAPIHKLIAPYVKPKRWTVEWNVDIWILLDHALERSYWCGLGELGRNGGDAAQRIADVFNEVMP